MIFALMFEAAIFGREISAAEHTTDIYITISGRAKFNQILSNVGRCVRSNGAVCFGGGTELSANLKDQAAKALLIVSPTVVKPI